MSIDNSIKKLTLDSVHRKLGAKMFEFAGYEMPIQYSGVTHEHLEVRKNVGVFDVSHMGEFYVKGPDATNFLQFVTSNDISRLSPGKVQYSCFPNNSGGIVDDLLVYCLSSSEYMLVVNASNISKNWNWLDTNRTSYDVELINSSESISLFAVQGPNSIKALQSLTYIDLNNLSYYTFESMNIADIPDVLVSATGYTGSGGFELYVPNDQANILWERIMDSGSEYGIIPIGLGARDTLRLEMGYCLYGNDINDNTSPIEAGLSWITKFNKEFINSGFLKRQKDSGVEKKLVAFELINRGVPRKNYVLADQMKNEIGMVTSGTMSPSLGKAIGMGYVKTINSKLGTEIFVIIRNKYLKARIVSLPFWKK